MKQKRKMRPVPGEPQRITKAVTHIRLLEANSSKLAALDALAPVYLALCQQYVTLFCTEETPNKVRAPPLCDSAFRTLAPCCHSTSSRDCTVLAY